MPSMKDVAIWSYDREFLSFLSAKLGMAPKSQRMRMDESFPLAIETEEGGAEK